MRYITKCAKSEGRRLTTSLKVWRHWRLTLNAQLTGRNRFTRSLSGGYKWRMAVVYASYALWTREAIKESVVRVSTELTVDERVEDGESMAMPNEFYKKQCHVWCFYSPFHISTALLIYLQKWSSFALPSRACSTCNFASPTPNFRLIRAVRFLSRV